ncbi:Uncharacterised protein [Legionella sainthelensi]|nr:Uncharacterised protein [Legionella sainthelensi]VEH37327.1 Uncharacterised protein [Legionella sainthelensi]
MQEEKEVAPSHSFEQTSEPSYFCVLVHYRERSLTFYWDLLDEVDARTGSIAGYFLYPPASNKIGLFGCLMRQK